MYSFHFFPIFVSKRREFTILEAQLPETHKDCQKNILFLLTMTSIA